MTVFRFRTSEWGVSGHRNSVSQVIGALRVVGCLRHIGNVRTYAGTDVILLVQDLHVTVIEAATGEILRQLVLDPTRNYQPTGRPPGPTPNKDNS